MARFGTLTLTGFIALIIASLSLSSASGQQPTGGALSKELADAVVGQWQGTVPSPARGDDVLEVCFKPDGTLSGDVQSVRGGLITFAGTYRPTDSGDGIVTQQKFLTGPQIVVSGNGASYTVKPTSSGTLEGTGTSDPRPDTFPVRFTKRTKTSC